MDLTSGSATLRLRAPARATGIVDVGWLRLLPLLVPCGLLVAGGVVGYAFTLNVEVARERLIGLIVASLLAVVASRWLSRIERTTPLLAGASVLALASGVWVIAASGPDVFRGPLGTTLHKVFGPVFGLVQVTDSVAVANTRFIVGYNGLADLCLVAIFCGAALLTKRGHPAKIAAPAVLIVASLVLLVGTGARGGLIGLGAGVCAIGLYAWPRRIALGALIAAPAALAAAAVGIFDKGLEVSSATGRLTYWADLTRLIVEYPLTGVGLGVDTANRVALLYELNPDPDRVFYAHNTFIQTYLEQGPLGASGMLLVPAIAIVAAFAARRHGAESARRPLLLAGLGVIGGLEAHGLTDQVVTTNIGTGLLMLALASILAALTPASLTALGGWTRRTSLGMAAVAAIVLGALVAVPAGRAQVLLDVGGLKLNQALALAPLSAGRAQAVGDAAGILTLALAQDAGHPGVLRELAHVRSVLFEDTAALEALQRAARSNRLDAFDMLQIARVYRGLGVVDEAYAWAARAYAASGRSPEDAVMREYAHSTLVDNRARTLADQAEAAMRARRFGEAHELFQQGLTFEPTSAYLQDRVGAAKRGVDKYGR